jgi:hypothetical protein
VEWINDLQEKTVGLDTARLIYFIEENPAYIEAVRFFFEAMDRGDFLVVTSTVTLLEVLVHPLRSNERKLATDYRDILLNSKLTTLEVSSSIAETGRPTQGRSQYPNTGCHSDQRGTKRWGKSFFYQ